MNSAEITNFLKIHEPLSWKLTILRGENQLIRWLPIIDISRAGYYSGLAAEGFWVCETRDKLLRLKRENSFVLLPILEWNSEEFLKELENSLKQVGLPTSMTTVFPVLEGVIGGLEQQSDYWAKLALNWLESCQELHTAQVVPVLERVTLAKWASQQVKQRSKRLLRELYSAR